MSEYSIDKNTGQGPDEEIKSMLEKKLITEENTQDVNCSVCNKENLEKVIYHPFFGGYFCSVECALPCLINRLYTYIYCQ